MLELLNEDTIALCKEACDAAGKDFDTILATADAYPEQHGNSVVAYGLLCMCIELAIKKKAPYDISRAS
jgi:hypothetical protein